MYGNKCSINQTHKKLTAEGLHVDKNALSDFVRWCEDAYILFSVRLWTSSEHRARTNPQKLYTADLGLAQACETWSDQNLGRRFENACFCFLRAQPDFLSLNYYITERGGEVDFIFENLAGQRFLYQICWELAAESKEREITALTEAMAELNLKKGYIVTFKQNETIKVASGQIQVISFDKFFKK